VRYAEMSPGDVAVSTEIDPPQPDIEFECLPVEPKGMSRL
jgi:hypothetical protein